MEEVLLRRESYDQRPIPYDSEPTVSITPVVIEGLDCYWFTPEDPSSYRIIIYLHGGGFAMGSVRTHGRMASHFAEGLQTRILFIEYALAPESPFPAGINDVVKVYQEVTNRYAEYQVSLIGDSAGGSLIISAIAEMLKMHLPLPHAAVLISPWINFACDYPSYEENAQIDTSLTRDMLEMFARAYTGDVPIEASSPGNVRFSQFPPVLIMVGTHEILLDDSKHFYDYIKGIQIKSRLSIYEGQPHVWVKKNILSAAAQRALTEIAEFIA